MKHIFENMHDAGSATRHALPIAWATFKTEWKDEYDRRAIARGADAAQRQAERTAEATTTKRTAKAKHEPVIIDGEAVKA